jgi:sugar phosphate isomerase/epimerase
MTLTLGCTTRPYGDLSFAKVCQHIAAAGYTDVALFRTVGVSAESTPDQIHDIRQTALDAGLEPSMLLGRTRLDLGLDAAVAEYRQLIDNAALLGARWLLDTGISQRELLDDYCAMMRQAAPHAEQAGMHITLKPHGGITQTTHDLIEIYRRVDHPAFGISYDPGNILYYSRGEEQPTTHLSEVAPLVTTAIIKDCTIVDGVPDVMVTPGEGLVDFRAVLSGLVEGGFRGPLYLECVGGDTMEEINDSVRRTKTYIQDIVTWAFSKGQGSGTSG